MIGARRERDPLSDDLAALDDLQEEVRRPIRRPTALIVPILITMIVMTGGVTIAWYSYNAGVKEGSEGAAPLLPSDDLSTLQYLQGAVRGGAADTTHPSRIDGCQVPFARLQVPLAAVLDQSLHEIHDLRPASGGLRHRELAR